MRILFAAFFWLALGLSGVFAQNAIVTENKLAGTPQSQWDLSGPGSTTLQGFATDISVNHGSTVNFKIQSGTNKLEDRYLPPGLLPGQRRSPDNDHQQDERSNSAGSHSQFDNR